MGYRTRAKSLTSDDAKKVSKRPKLETLDETKALMIGKLKSQIKQKTKSKSDSDVFEELQDIDGETRTEIKVKNDLNETALIEKIKDEVQAWVIPEVKNYYELESYD